MENGDQSKQGEMEECGSTCMTNQMASEEPRVGVETSIQLIKFKLKGGIAGHGGGRETECKQ